MRRAYSLLELMAVVAVIALCVGIGVVNMQGVSDAGKLQAAADQIAAAYRLALVESTRSGRPIQLAMTRTSCAIRKPILSDGEWQWAAGAKFDVPDSLVIARVDSTALNDRELVRQVCITPDNWAQQVEVELQAVSGSRLVARIGANGISPSATKKTG